MTDLIVSQAGVVQSRQTGSAGQTLRVTAMATPMVDAMTSDVLIFADESGSMSGLCTEGKTRMVAARAAAAGFCRGKAKMDPRGRVSIGGFSDAARISLDFTLASEASVIRNAIDALSERGGTNITAALHEASRTFGATERVVPQYLVLLSDGHHNGAGNPVAAAEELKLLGVVIFTVGFAESPDHVDPRLPQIASPGKYTFCSDLDQLMSHFQSVSRQTSLRRPTTQERRSQ